MSDKPKCPYCSADLAKAFLYVRGIAGALFHSKSPDTGLLSRSGLEQIRLDEISRTEAGAQVVIDALRCDSCDSITFRAS